MSTLITAYSTLTNPPAIDFPCKLLNQLSLESSELPDHLDDFIGFVMNAGDGEMNSRRYALYRHIQRVRHLFSIEIDEDKFDQFADWGWRANVIIYLYDNTIRNPDGDVLQDPYGKFDKNATMPYPLDAKQRKAKKEQYLKELGINVPTSLPPVVAESEVVLRSPDEIAHRALALMICCIQAEGFYENDPIDPDEFKQRCPIGYAALSDNERAFIHSKQPEQKDVINKSWRYEALLALQWAIEWQSQLPFADTVCDSSDLVNQAMNYNQQPNQSVNLRPVSEILDALDLHYRLHWLTREYGREDKALPASINGGVIYERHYALNWLTNFENADWDDVDTPT